MKRVLLAMVVAAFATAAGAQTSTSTTSSGAATEKPASKWSGGIVTELERSGRLYDPYDIDSPIFDRDATEVDGTLHLNANYKLNNGASIKINQRVFYSQWVDQSRQMGALLGTLRISYSTKLFSQGGIAYRVTLPSTYEAWQDGFLTNLAILPNYSWTLSPKVSLSYSGYLGASFYTQRREASVISRLIARDAGVDAVYQARAKANAQGKVLTLAEEAAAAQKAADATMERRMNASGDSRGWYYANSNLALGYAITDKVSVSQAIGYSISELGISRPRVILQALNLGTSLDVQATDKVSLSLGIAQNAALQEGSMDPVLGKVLFYRSDFALYLPEQTTWNFTTSVTF